MKNILLATALIARFALTWWLFHERKDARRVISILTSDNAFLDARGKKLNLQVDDLYAALKGAKP